MTVTDRSPSDSTVSGIIAETVEEDSDDEERTIQDEQMSEASSVGSVLLDVDGINLGDMIDLTSPTKCRIFMTRTERGQRIYCCCGNDRESCGRRNHLTKGEQHRAPARWYQAFPTRGTSQTIDGRMDRLRTGLTQEEMVAWRDSEREEIARVTAAFDDTDEEGTLDGSFASAAGSTSMLQQGASTPLCQFIGEVEDTMDAAIEGVRQVTFGPNQYSTTPVADNRTTEGNPESTQESTSAGGQDPRGSSPQDTRQTRPLRMLPAESDDGNPTWHGLREANTQIRRICNTREDLAYWINRQARVCRTFDTRTAAEEWLRNGDDDDRMVWMGLEKGDGRRHVTPNVGELLARVEAGYQHVRTFANHTMAMQWLANATPIPPARDPEVEVTGVRRGGRFGRGGAPTSRAPRDGGSEPDAPGEDPRPWYGLVEPTRARVICHTVVERDDLIAQGADWCATFYTLREAEEWMQSAPPPPRDTIRRGPVPGSVGPQFSRSNTEPVWPRPNDQRESVPSVSEREVPSFSARDFGTQNSPSLSNHGIQGLVETRETYAKFEGQDPSVGDANRIYGIDQSDIGPMELALSPLGLDSKECSQFVERSLDVTALPGMYSADNYDSVTSGEELAASLLQQMDSKRKETLGHDGLWQTKRAHSLGYIKSADDLKKMAKNVRKAWKSAWKAQLQRWSSYLYERRYPKLFVVEYLRYGLLPRIIQDTYENYIGLLTTARELLYSEEAAVKWKGSRAEALIEYHGEKLRQLRSYSANYRAHILGTYVYLRDAASKTEYRNEALLDPLWDRVHDLQQKYDESGGSTTTSGGGKSSRCAWCHRNGLHAEGKTNCPAKDLSCTQARKLLKGVQKSVGLAKIKQACTEFANQLAANADGDVDEIIANVRSSQLGLT